MAIAAAAGDLAAIAGLDPEAPASALVAAGLWAAWREGLGRSALGVPAGERGVVATAARTEDARIHADLAGLRADQDLSAPEPGPLLCLLSPIARRLGELGVGVAWGQVARGLAARIDQPGPGLQESEPTSPTVHRHVGPHAVGWFLRRLRPGQQAGQAARQQARVHGVPLPAGFTFVREHTRGNLPPEQGRTAHPPPRS